MALTAQEFTEMADLAVELGDEQAELEALEGLESVGGLGVQPDFPGAGIIEPARAVGSAIAQTAGGGLAGIAQALTPGAPEGAGAETVRGAQEKIFQPTTQAGQEGLETLGQFIEAGIDIVNFPLSGLEGLSRLIKGQGLEQAVSTIRDIQQSGLGQNIGTRALEATGSPLLATAAELSPDIGAIIAGAPAAGAGRRAAVDATGKVLAPISEQIETVARGLATRQSPEKQRIAQLLIEGSDDVETAGFRLVAPDAARTGQPKRPEQPTRLQEFLDIGGPKIEKFPAAQNAIKQGFGQGVIAAVQGASTADKTAMAEMVDIAERIKKNARFGLRNRPSDVTGDLLMSKLNVVRKANRDAGKSIRPIANALAGKPVNVREMGQSFSDSLDDMGITLTKDKTGKIILNFIDSDIEGVTAAESVITKVVNRIQRVAGDGEIDALKLHKLKKFIDEQVTFGKNAEGLAGQAEQALKGLRRNIRETLGEKFPEYAEANATFSETIDILDRFQDVAGRKMNLTGDNAEKATGTLMRRLMGNAQSRIRLLDSIDEIEKAAKKFGGRGQKLIEGLGGSVNDLLTQVLFASELDEVFGPAARTSLQGEFDAVIKRAARATTTKAGAADVALDIGAGAVGKARGINEANAFKAIKELLKEVNK